MMSSYYCPTCHLRFKSNSSLIHHFDNFPVCKRAKPELCRLSSSDNTGVAVAFQQVLPISHLSFIEDAGAILDIDNGNAFTNCDESLLDDYSYSMDQDEQNDPPLFQDLTARLLLDEDSEITDDEGSIGNDSDGALTPTFAMSSGVSFANTPFSTMAVYTPFTTSLFCHNEMPDSLSPVAEANLHPAEEALLALVIENCLPINVYNKILDWAQYARFTGYDEFSTAPIYGTVLRRMEDKYAQRSGGPPMSEIVVVDGYQPMHVYRFNFLQQAARLFSNGDLMEGALWDYDAQVDPVTNERVYAEMNTGDFWKLGTDYVIRCAKMTDPEQKSHHVFCPVNLFIDATLADRIGRLKVEPVLCSFGNICGKKRQNASAWFILGFIPPYPKSSIESQADRRSEDCQ